jgi:Flavin-binding monooxygenase-like
MTGTKGNKYCIIGAGACGLAVAKNFKQRGIPFDCLERENDIGGLWNIATSSGIVYETTHLVSASYLTGYDDFPMDEQLFYHYPSHILVLGYLRDYAYTFGLNEHIELGRTVERAAPRADKLWEVQVQGERGARVYRGIVVANGHHEVPRMPTYPGTFTGEIIHSRQYKSPRQVRDKRVLVVGAGNSACDILTDAVHGGSKVFLSMRRGYWFVPKFMLGFATHDVVATVELLPLPRIFKRWLFEASLWVLVGPAVRFQLPKPEYHVDQAHPTMSDEVPHLAAHGRLAVRPEIAHYSGRRVHFADGTSEEIDMIVFATGYSVAFPFLDSNLVFDADGRSQLFLNTVHPAHPGLFAAGLIQANGSIWRLADYQGQLIANTIIAEQRARDVAKSFRARIEASELGLPRGTFVASDRHKLEANYFVYRRLIKQHLRRFGRVRRLSFEPIGAVDDRETARASAALHYKLRRSEPVSRSVAHR